jgi:murein DD-endopeptidase
MQKHKIRFFGDTLGLAPLPLRLKQAMVTFVGEEDVPSSKWGLSSLSQLHPTISHKLWRGKFHVPRKVIISNLFNHTQTPIEEGWSVRKTQIKDFRGKGLTYNSHNGTDFAIPVGTSVYNAAPGKIVAVLSQFNRGGLKIFIDHGDGLMTCYAHLAKSLVNVGDVLNDISPIAISGYSGIDGVMTFPLGIPHIHFNVWLNGEPVDPFAHGNEISMWAGGDEPKSFAGSLNSYKSSSYNPKKVKQAIANCKTATTRNRLASLTDIEEQAAHTIIEMNYYPTRFTERINVYDKNYSRKPSLYLPFSVTDFDGLVFIDEM